MQSQAISTPTEAFSIASLPLPNALAFHINEVRRMGGPGRTKVYELIRTGALKAVKAGGRTVIVGVMLRAIMGNARDMLDETSAPVIIETDDGVVVEIVQ